jgi:hypothetical protein
VERVNGGLDEEHSQGGISGKQSGHEVLVAPPHVVPSLEGHDNNVGHSTLR